MKKLLLTSAIVGVVAFAAAPAKADIQLGLGGHFKGYVTWDAQDNAAGGATERHVDIVRDTELHFTGETTLDNGLTVGFHSEMLANPNGANALGDQSGTTQNFGIQESYAYFAGNWGRVNFGAEDGAAFLLQVAAPSADSNYDGIRQYVNPFNHTFAQTGYTTISNRLDYAQDATGDHDKLTYITPVFSGFQAALSYTPSVNTAGNATGASSLNYNSPTASNTYGVTRANSADRYGAAWEAAARYEGQFQAARVTLGGGYTTVNRDGVVTAGLKDDQVYNLGANVGFNAFNVGVVYKHDNNGEQSASAQGATKTWVGGVDYTTGPFVLGASYLDQKQDNFNALNDLHTKRYAGGVTYTYGPGMSFRGSIGHVSEKIQNNANSDKGTDLLLGTQIGF